jgi:hypothetical protein
VDYRIYDLENNGKTKLDHVREMLVFLVGSKDLTFDRVLMDSWQAVSNKFFTYKACIFTCEGHFRIRRKLCVTGLRSKGAAAVH